MILTFAPPLADALLAGRKSVTRRTWTLSTAQSMTRQYEQGHAITAYRGNPRNGGEPIARLALTQRPVLRDVATMPQRDYEREGLAYIDEDELRQRLYLPAICRLLDMPITDSARQAFNAWRERGGNVWVIRFQVLEAL